MALQLVYKKIKPSIVAIISEFSRDPRFPQILGTGFIVRDDGIVFTNRHVIELIHRIPRKKGSSDIPIKALLFKDFGLKGMATFSLSVIGFGGIKLDPVPEKFYGDENLDIGFIELGGVKGLQTLKIHEKFDLTEGDQVAIAGFPMGTNTLMAPGWVQQLGPTLQTGIVSAVLPFPCSDPHELLLDLMVQGGSSGSPVFLPDSGEVVGIIYAGLEETFSFGGQKKEDRGIQSYNVPTTLTCAVPCNWLLRTFEKLDEVIPLENINDKIPLNDYLKTLKEVTVQPKIGERLEPYNGAIIFPVKRE